MKVDLKQNLKKELKGDVRVRYFNYAYVSADLG